MKILEKSFVWSINLVLALGMFVFGMSAFYIGMFWLIEFLTAAGTWANTGRWPPFTLLQYTEKYSVPVPHTNMIGFQNIIDGWLDQSGLVWFFFIMVGCAGMSNWLGELIIPMTPKKAAQKPTGPKRYTDDELRRAIDKTVVAHRKGIVE
jgi:hypothetical protein